MQFREQARRIQVLAYRGYDKEKKRAIIKLLGSFDRYSFSPSDGLLDNLTAEEKIELEAHIETMRQSVEKTNRQYKARHVASQIASAADSITREEFDISDGWAADCWAAIDELSRAMRKAGYPKPPRKAPQKAAGAGVEGQAGLLLVDA